MSEARLVDLIDRDLAEAIHDELRERLPMWTLYERPLDYPAGWVARLFVTLPEVYATTVCVRGPDRAAVEALVPRDMVFLARQPGDQPQIVGCWL
jgi:hypothetical protein